MRGVTTIDSEEWAELEFQLTRLMRGVTQNIGQLDGYLDISTHTPHARRDTLNETQEIHPNISTHTPHARRDY